MSETSTKKFSLRQELRQILQGLYAFDRVISYVEIGLLVVFLFGLILAEIVGIFIYSATWMKQLFKYMVIWIGLLGASLATRSSEHISITVIPQGGKFFLYHMVGVLANGSALAIGVVITLSSWNYIFYEKWDWESNMSSGSANQVEISDFKIYLPKHSLATMKRETREAANEYAAMLKLVLHNDKDRDVQQGLVESIKKKLEKCKVAEENAQQWKNNWLQEHWPVWQQELARAWEKDGKSACDSMYSKKLVGDELQWFRVRWQEKWIQEQWEKQWHEECLAAWEKIGERPADKDQWQTGWIAQQWEKSWKGEWALAWQQQGLKAYFQQKWCESWLKARWQNDWGENLYGLLNGASHYLLIAPSPREDYSETYLKIPRWMLRLILPVALSIITFRFALRTLDAVVALEHFQKTPAQN